MQIAPLTREGPLLVGCGGVAGVAEWAVALLSGAPKLRPPPAPLQPAICNQPNA